MGCTQPRHHHLCCPAPLRSPRRRLFAACLVVLRVLRAASGLNLVRQGAQNRQKAATRLNIDSSRSHSVFTIELVTRPLSSSSSSAASSVSDDASVSSNGGGSGRPADTVGTLWIVDLAGSERSGRTGHSSGSVSRYQSKLETGRLSAVKGACCSLPDQWVVLRHA